MDHNLQGIRLLYLGARLGSGGWLGPGQGAGGRDCSLSLIPGATVPGEKQGPGRGVALR